MRWFLDFLVSLFVSRERWELSRGEANLRFTLYLTGDVETDAVARLNAWRAVSDLEANGWHLNSFPGDS